MATPEILDFDKLCEPVSEAQPTGPYLRDDDRTALKWSEFEDARRNARAAEKARLEADPNNPPSELPDWAKVQSLGEQLLAESKDLWVVAGMIDAMTREYGFAGVRDGFRLVSELCERYWGDLHPTHEAGDKVHTAAIRLDSLNESLPRALYLLPIADSNEYESLTVSDYVVATEGRGGKVDLATVHGAARTTKPEFYRDMIDDVAQAIEEVGRTSKLLDERCRTDEADLSPTFAGILDRLDDCQRRIRTLAKDIGIETSAHSEGAVAGEPISESGEPAKVATGPSRDQLATREDAFRMLTKLATYFETTEPLSPIGPALRQLTRWRTMTFAELMHHLIEDASARRELFRRTGVEEEDKES